MKNITAHTGNGSIGTRLEKMGSVPLSIKDINNAEEVRENLHRVKPDVIIHTAGISSPEECEKDFDKAILVNYRGTSVLCEEAENILGIGKVALLSTDHVFNGQLGNYAETDEPDPINDYGRTKLGAEGVIHLYEGKVIRLSRGFDSKSKDIATYISLLENGSAIYVPSFIKRNYYHNDFVALNLMEYARDFHRMPKVLNIASTTLVTFYRFMKYMAGELGLPSELIYERKEPDSGFSPRPLSCGLNVTRAINLGLAMFSTWDSVEKYKKEMQHA